MRLHVRTRSLLRAGLLLLAIIYPGTPCVTSTTSAATLTSRSITLNSSTPGATGVNYLVSFTTPSSAQSIIIEFCGDSPLIGASCDTGTSTITGLPGFAASNATFTNVSGLSNWSFLKSQWRLRFTKNTGSATGAGSTVSFVIGNVTNMSVARTFYARVYTYSDTAYGGASPYSSATNPGGYLDSGGFALSTAASFTVTARVMESLIFCVSGIAPGANCGSSTDPTITLGHGTNNILDSTQVDATNVYAQASTNAQNGITLSAKSGTSCAGLSNDGGSACPIVAQNSGSNPGIISAGSGQFGLGVTASGGLSAVTKYDGSLNKTNYDPSTLAGVRSLYGENIASSSGPIDSANATIRFAASAAPTTPAGQYSTNVILIVSATF